MDFLLYFSRSVSSSPFNTTIYSLRGDSFDHSSSSLRPFWASPLFLKLYASRYAHFYEYLISLALWHKSITALKSLSFRLHRLQFIRADSLVAETLSFSSGVSTPESKR